MIDGLQALLDMDARRTPVRVVGDAKAVIYQMDGLAKVSSQTIIPLHRKATRLADKLHIVDWEWVPRGQNKAADQLARRAMREFHTDHRLEEDARITILEDSKARRNSLRIFAGMLVFMGQTR
jgi:probable phosphoglycerate mutase